MSALRDRLAEYVSHKRVRAGEIVHYGTMSAGHEVYVDVKTVTGEIERVSVTDELYHRGDRPPDLGDRLVVYGEGADEYLSISPKKAFEEGYRPVTPAAVRLKPTIAELEALLATDADVEILPNGEVRAHPAVRDIGWAVRQMQQTLKVARAVRLGWSVALIDGEFWLVDLAGGRVQRQFCSADLLATDWVVVP